MVKRNFERNKPGRYTYSLKRQTELGNLIKKYKDKYDSLVQENKDKANYDRELK